MALRILLMLMVFGIASTKPTDQGISATPKELQHDDLTAASSTYSRPYSGGYPGGNSYSGYGVTGYGILDDKYNNYNSYYGGSGSYDNGYGYNGYSGGYPGYSGYTGNAGYGGYNDYNGYKRYGGYGANSYSGNGGYGGYGGNGGLASYSGYNNPYYQGAYHLGYGYYRKPGNIYNSGVTPNLVTGYRGYSR